jgi:hypothetical protein
MTERSRDTVADSRNLMRKCEYQLLQSGTLFFGRSGDETAHEFRFIVSFLFVMFPNVTLFVIRGGLGSRSASQKKAAKL